MPITTIKELEQGIKNTAEQNAEVLENPNKEIKSEEITKTSVQGNQKETVEKPEIQNLPEAKKPEEKIQESIIEKEDIEEMDIDIEKIKMEKEKKKNKGLLKRLSTIGTISPREVVEFTRHLSVMLGAGVTIFEAISFLKKESKNKVFADRLENILNSLNNGQSLSAAMKKYPKVFPNIYTNIVHVGEQSG